MAHSCWGAHRQYEVRYEHKDATKAVPCWSKTPALHAHEARNPHRHPRNPSEHLGNLPRRARGQSTRRQATSHESPFHSMGSPRRVMSLRPRAGLLLGRHWKSGRQGNRPYRQAGRSAAVLSGAHVRHQPQLQWITSLCQCSTCLRLVLGSGRHCLLCA